MGAAVIETESPEYRLDDTDRRIIEATQGGLPVCARPFHHVADGLGLDAAEVMVRFRRMMEAGVVRRVAAVPNHYRLGYRVNGMSVWDVSDDFIDKLGPQVGELEFVSHCYRRPRRPPVWPYNLFAMVHGRGREEVDEAVEAIAALLGDACRAHDVLFSSRILKKTGLRLARTGS